jgi:hypothetical protein
MACIRKNSTGRIQTTGPYDKEKGLCSARALILSEATVSTRHLQEVCSFFASIFTKKQFLIGNQGAIDSFTDSALRITRHDHIFVLAFPTT